MYSAKEYFALLRVFPCINKKFTSQAFPATRNIGYPVQNEVCPNLLSAIGLGETVVVAVDGGAITKVFNVKIGHFAV